MLGLDLRWFIVSALGLMACGSDATGSAGGGSAGGTSGASGGSGGLASGGSGGGGGTISGGSGGVSAAFPGPDPVITPEEMMVCPTGPAPDVLAERLCPDSADPEGATDKVFIDCAIETGCFATATPAPKDDLLVMAYNIERGQELDAQLEAFQNDSRLPVPDVLLLSEVDRGCGRSGYRNVLREYAETLGMNYVYGVEFVELPRGGSMDVTCEHGNGILSRYPMANATALRHASNKSWYDDKGEPRLGGRVAIRADIVIGARNIHVMAVHFESNGDETYREAQSTEIAELGLNRGGRVVVGGDMNSGFYSLTLSAGLDLDKTVSSFLSRGYQDSHIELDVAERSTHASGRLLDVIVTNGAFSSDPVIAPAGSWEALADHAAIWTTIHLD